MAHGFLMDSWEGMQGMSSLRAKLLGKGWQQLPLEPHYPGADFCWLTDHSPPRRVALQRKTVSDLIYSWFEGRLQRQLYDLCRAVELPGLLVDGLPYYNPQDGGILTAGRPLLRVGKPIPYSTFTHILSELTGSRDGASFHLILLPGPMDYLVLWLSELGPKWFDRPIFEGWSRGELPPRHTDSKVQALLGFPGLGEQRAKDLLAYYGSVSAVIHAVEKGELVVKGKAVVKGVGVATQLKILEALL